MLEQTLAFVKAAKSARSFVEWLESTGPSTLLAEIELDAAAAAFRNLKITVDTRAQLWNAVNHLETAYHAAYRVAKQEAKSWKNLRMAHAITRRSLANKCELILCLLGLCYKLLKEDQLMHKCIESLGGVYDIKYGQNLGGKEWVVFPFQVLTVLPQIWLDVALKSENSYISWESREEVEAMLKTEWQDT